MTREEVIKYGKEQLDVFGGKHADFIKSVIELLERKPISKNKEVRLIDANKLYEYIDDIKYTCNTYAEVEDILEIIDNQPTVNAINITPNLTNKGFIKKSFPSIEIDNKECNGVVYGYKKSNSIKSIVPLMGFKANWLKEKYRKENR